MYTCINVYCIHECRYACINVYMTDCILVNVHLCLCVFMYAVFMSTFNYAGM